MRRMRACRIVSALVGAIVVSAFSMCVWAGERCDDWVAKVVSVQGRVQALRTGQVQWLQVALDDTYCAGDVIWVQEQSRAAVVLRNDAILRLDQNTTVTFAGPEEEETLLIKLLKGVAHFFSRTPRSLRVATPFVNGAGEGTEFLVRVEPGQTLVSVFEGRVALVNEAGSLLVKSGESALARADQPPVPQAVVRPRDAVQWALYYPPVVDYRPDDFSGGAEDGWEGVVRRSLEFYWGGDLAGAFDSLKGAPEDIRDPRFFTYRAALLLSVGRVEEAQADIEKALTLYPSYSQALALEAIIAVAQNRKAAALELARKAVDLGPQSAVARVAISYAQQASFDLHGALASVQEAVRLGPQNALAWARLAELWLSFGYLDRALEAARTAVSLNPDLARTQSVLGFAHLTQIEIEESKRAFHQAIALDQGDPLPRLGLGLAKIPDGDLHEGRREIEIAASLDPNNSLVRSYLGKAYFDEKRTGLDGTQYAVAKELDPLDPTPYFYDAILKQTTNRPVEALQDLQKSIELNDNRAVYRSRLLLDQDLGARSAALGQIFRDLGFEQIALVEGWTSVSADPANYSAHRLLSDLYSSLPRHDMARVSELLQSQLLQPINITPVQPQLAQRNLFILENAGPSTPSFNEFNPLFNRNRFALLADGVTGNHGTLGDDLVQSAVWRRLSYSLGQFHYETNGVRKNNDLDEDLYNAFVQVSLTPQTSVQAEYRHKDFKSGDLEILFDPENFFPELRDKSETESLRFGLHQSFSPKSDFIASFICSSQDADQNYGPSSGFREKFDGTGYSAEGQYLFHTTGFNLVGGAGHSNVDEKVKDIFSGVASSTKIKNPYTDFYLYSYINYPHNVIWTLGGSADFIEIDQFDRKRQQFNPKIGVTWNPLPNTTLRAAAFRTLMPPGISEEVLSGETLEPTQVAGFNQFFQDGVGTDSWRYGVGIDQKLSSNLYAGAEFTKRDLEVLGTVVETNEVRKSDLEEQFARAYLYWTPHPWLAVGPEYQFERFKNPKEFMIYQISQLETHRFSLGFSFFHPSGLFARFTPTFVSQEGKFQNFESTPAGPIETIVPDDSHFFVLNASIGYRLPKRFGIISINGSNLFDKSFKFQDTDPANPHISRERLILVKITLAL